ncbi:MAG TPA: transcription antitermination factor NusB, partial [Bryobacteraceae bacterium]|nr:transcription antitermination factor NusB [Bryobacteraceae bacterium]
MSISPGRRVAFEVLLRVAGGAYASDLLAARSATLDSRDAGLAGEIVFGVLRYRAQIDWVIAEACGRERRLDEEVRTALRMGIYQLRYLERIPAHAAVGEAVELVKRARKGSAAGFVNAVLRKAGGRGPGTGGRGGALWEGNVASTSGAGLAGESACPTSGSWPSREIELSCPEWLLERWERQYGEEAAAEIARAALRPPEKYFRGERMQDIGSQAIVPLLRLEAGQTFLDVCAAP